MFSSSQQKLISYFQNAVSSDSLRQSYIIKGEAGLGKKEACKEISRYIMCQSGTACGKCNGCLSFGANANPDCIIISNEDKKTIELEKIRRIIKEAYIKPVSGRYKLFIIQNAHLMDPAPQNALLKVIEEPPSYAIFLMLCDNLNSIYPTILSRSHCLELEHSSTDDLKKICPLSPKDDYMYTYCMGNIGTLKAISSDDEFKNIREGVIKTFCKMIKTNDYSLYEAIDFWLANKERKTDLINILTMFLRDVVFVKNGQNTLIANTDKVSEINLVCQKVTLTGAFNMLTQVNDVPRLLGKYGNFAMVVQSLFTGFGKL